MQQIQVQLKNLREHPAQMRTEMGTEEMARLTLQVCERGLDAHQPIVAAANGDGTFRVVSGHRRWLAALLAHEVRARLDGRKKTVVDLDFVYQLVLDCASAQPTPVAVCALCGAVLEGGEDAEGWCPTCENRVEVQVEPRSVASPSALMGLYGPLTERHGEDKVPIVLFEGGEKEEILALQAANFGQEAPDLLGQARSYAAVQAGATVAEIAANTGQSVGRVEAVLALSGAPQGLAQAIVAGDVALGVAAEVARLRKKAQREGITRYILERETCTVEEVHDVVSALRKWQPPAVSLDPDTTPNERNHARLLAALWADAEKNDPARAWRAAAWAVTMHGMRLEHLDVQGDERGLLCQAVPEARCENCQLRELLRAAPPFRYPHYACQQAEEPGPCFDGVFGQDPFYVQVPFGWEEYPGVQCTNRRGPVCLSAEDFRQAVEAAARPAGGESHKGWFLEGLKNEIGNLSDGQLWTLVTWVTADWMRHSGRGRQYLLPLPDGRTLCYADRT
jgi:hypothetical protein